MSAPKSKVLTNTILDNKIPLLVHGQGVLLFEACPGLSSALFYILDSSGMNGFRVEFGPGFIHVSYQKTLEPLLDSSNAAGLTKKSGAYYWFSLDSQNQKLYAGVGEPRLETLLYQFTLPPSQKQFLESLTKIHSISINPKKLLRDPITRKVPLRIKQTDDLTMSDIARGDIIPKANLSPVAQKLYDCISGKLFTLDDKEFPEFSQAIEHSIRTPGCWCNKRLVEKATEFSKDPHPLETYLRITLGENNGESPGVPYVMEIWPVGHYSPIHSHADANAVIRVLHGKIHVQLYPFLCDDSAGVKEFAAVDFEKDEVTWLSPTLNQIHRLTNLPTNSETCITIQCYMYDESNSRHYDYFDYLDDKGVKHKYTPDSDMDFMAFKEQIKKEWMEFKSNSALKHAPYRLC